MTPINSLTNNGFHRIAHMSRVKITDPVANTRDAAKPSATQWLPYSTSGFRGFGEYHAELESMYWRR